jgi:hypothetical protein
MNLGSRLCKLEAIADQDDSGFYSLRPLDADSWMLGAPDGSFWRISNEERQQFPALAGGSERVGVMFNPTSGVVIRIEDDQRNLSM